MLFSAQLCDIITKTAQGGRKMAGIQNFRSALGGFKRGDVVRYIEYMNNQHNTQVAQLNTQLQTALSQASPAQLAQLQQAVIGSKTVMQETAMAMFAIAPKE